jgi:hypothetical protein
MCHPDMLSNRVTIPRHGQNKACLLRKIKRLPARRRYRVIRNPSKIMELGMVLTQT